MTANDFTPKQIESHKRLCEAATNGPWYCAQKTPNVPHVINSGAKSYIATCSQEGIGIAESRANSGLIVAARNYWPRYISLVEQQRGEIARLKTIEHELDVCKEGFEWAIGAAKREGIRREEIIAEGECGDGHSDFTNLAVIATEARWQKRLDKHIFKNCPTRDGSGVDSGDPLDLTEAELMQAFNAKDDEIAELKADNDRLRALRQTDGAQITAMLVEVKDFRDANRDLRTSLDSATELELAARQECDRLRAVVERAYLISSDAPELNLSNYDHEQVAALNSGMTNVFLVLRDAATPEAARAVIALAARKGKP